MIGSSLSVMNSVSTLMVRDFLVQFRPRTAEKTQVLFGRMAIALSTPLAIAAAYLIYMTPDGLYKYLQTISIYLVMPVTPAIFFGIVSKRVTVKGALVSVLLGIALATVYVTDQLVGPAAGAAWFPWLHTKLTLNYTYRGLWGTLIVIATLYLVSAFTEKRPSATLEGLTINWHSPMEPFRGLRDWRLHLALLTLVTIGLYAWLW